MKTLLSFAALIVLSGCATPTVNNTIHVISLDKAEVKTEVSITQPKTVTTETGTGNKIPASLIPGL